jgi:hypothetical protein
MKDCPLCEGEFAEIDAKMHEMFDMHKTDEETWKPERGHPSKEIHDKIITFLEKYKNLEKERDNWKDKYNKLLARPWYKRIFINHKKQL